MENKFLNWQLVTEALRQQQWTWSARHGELHCAHFKHDKISPAQILGYGKARIEKVDDVKFEGIKPDGLNIIGSEAAISMMLGVEDLHSMKPLISRRFAPDQFKANHKKIEPKPAKPQIPDYDWYDGEHGKLCAYCVDRMAAMALCNVMRPIFVPGMVIAKNTPPTEQGAKYMVTIPAHIRGALESLLAPAGKTIQKAENGLYTGKQ